MRWKHVTSTLLKPSTALAFKRSDPLFSDSTFAALPFCREGPIYFSVQMSQTYIPSAVTVVSTLLLQIRPSEIRSVLSIGLFEEMRNNFCLPGQQNKMCEHNITPSCLSATHITCR